jgi:hypothetical protein
VVTWAQFEEKEYEVGAAVELAEGRAGRPVFSSGQVLEALLGYDAVAHPDAAHRIWRLLELPRPDGVVLVPGYWRPGSVPPSHALPRSPVSLVLQYKRPEYLVGATAGQWRFWHRPYLRFTVNGRQQAVLARLERALGDQAAVRYACPAFWQRGQYEAALVTGRVLERSGFVRPQTMVGHRVWSYIEPGADGRANPSGRAAWLERLGDVLLGLADAPNTGQAVVVPDGLAGHLAVLGRAARERQPALRAVLARFAEQLDDSSLELTSGQAQAVLNIAAITSLAVRLGASWHVLDRAALGALDS